MLSGCSATVNINIDSDEITENIEIFATNESEYSKITNWNGFPLTLYYDQELSNPFAEGGQKESGVPYYKTSFSEPEKKATISGEFDFDNHQRSSVIRGCFEYYEVRQYGENYIFSTSSGLICDFSNINVVISTPYKVTLHNATKVDSVNNKYTWKINDSNKKDISLYFEIDSSSKVLDTDIDNESFNSGSDNSFNVMFLIFAGIIIFIVMVVGCLILKKRKNDLSDI